jgi:hypothetical protein
MIVIKKSNTWLLYNFVWKKIKYQPKTTQVFVDSFMKPNGSLKFLKYQNWRVLKTKPLVIHLGYTLFLVPDWFQIIVGRLPGLAG